VVYAWLGEQFDAQDRITGPVFIAAHATLEEVESAMLRPKFDAWLLSPVGVEAQGEDALLRFLGAA
jgi:hypothetical protein